jgi:hypothetical protein
MVYYNYQILEIDYLSHQGKTRIENNNSKIRINIFYLQIKIRWLY